MPLYLALLNNLAHTPPEPWQQWEELAYYLSLARLLPASGPTA